MILTTPLLQRLAVDGPVHVVATPANAGLLANHPAVTSVVVFDKRGGDRGWAGLRRLARRVRALEARRAYLAQGSLRTAAVARLAGIPERIGFETSPGRLLYTRRVPFPRDRHHAERLWSLATPPGATDAPPTLRPSLFPGARERAQWEAVLTAEGVAPTERFIALAPGSVWATKRWPHFGALAAALSRDALLHTYRLVVLGAASDTPLAAEIAAAVSAVGGRPSIDATGRLTLLASAAAIGHADVLVTNDSSPLHLASAMDTPTVALFGPTVPAFGFGPLASQHDVVEHPTLACRPCHAHGPMQCPLAHWQCMRDLSADRVADRLRTLMAAGR